MRNARSRLLTVVALGAIVLLLPGMFRGVLAQGTKATLAPTLVPQATSVAPGTAAATAGAVSPVSNVATPGQADILLSDLGLADYELVSPSSQAQFRFTVPDNWELKGLNTLQLALDYTQVGLDLLKDSGSSPLSSVIKVYVDEKLVNTTYLPATQQGPQTLSVQLPLDVIGRADRRNHTLRVALEAQEVCLVNAQVRIVIHTDQSVLHLEYKDVPPTLNLADYPAPFYNNGFKTIAEVATIVLPTRMTAADVEAGAIVAAGLGKLSGNAVTIRTIDADSLTADDRNGNLILVGSLDAHPIISQLIGDKKLPIAKGADSAITINNRDKVGADDGILQIIANPGNAQHAILAVTGQSADAVKKAAQALVSSTTSTLMQGPTVLVSNFQDVAPVQAAATTTITFKDLGYTDDITVQGRGARFIDIDFPIPLDMQLTADAYVNLMYQYSNTVAGARTSITLLMNGTPFASAFLDNSPKNGQAAPTPASAQNVLRAAIPPSAANSGRQNRLSIQVETQGDWKCFAPSQTAIFFTASADSQISLPMTAANLANLSPRVSWFPSAFNRSQTLDDVMLSLPTAPTADELNQAMRIAARLASGTSGTRGFNPHVIMGDLPEGTDLSKYHLIVFGRQTTNPVLKSLNEKLPQPFLDNSDEVKQVMDNVVYKLSQDYPIGILETLVSPWSPSHLVLVVTGSRPDAQLHAGDMLLDPQTDYGQLIGDVVYIRDKVLSAIDSRRVRENAGLLTAIPDMSTKVAQAGTETAVPATPTSVDQPTVTITPLYTVTPQPTVITPFPTYPPLDPGQSSPNAADVARPLWIDALFTLTLVILFASAVFGVLRATRRSSKR